MIKLSSLGLEPRSRFAFSSGSSTRSVGVELLIRQPRTRRGRIRVSGPILPVADIERNLRSGKFTAASKAIVDHKPSVLANRGHARLHCSISVGLQTQSGRSAHTRDRPLVAETSGYCA